MVPSLLSSLASAKGQVQALLPPFVFAGYESLLAETSKLFPQDDDSACDSTQQRGIDEVLWEKTYRDLLVSSPQTERACMLSARQPLSYSWLHAIPHPNLGMCVDDRTVTTGVSLRLHATVCQSHQWALCGHAVQGNGHHAHHCGLCKGRFFRHTMVNREIAAMLHKVDIPTIREPSGTHLDPHLRPDGSTLVAWHRGKFLAWDVTVADTVAPSYVSCTSLRAGGAAEKLEAQKTHKYRAILPEYTFQPIGLETLGAM